MKRLAFVAFAALAALAAAGAQAHGDKKYGWGGPRHFYDRHSHRHSYPAFVAPHRHYVPRYYAPVRVERYYYDPVPIYYERPYYARPGVTISVPPVFIGLP